MKTYSYREIAKFLKWRFSRTGRDARYFAARTCFLLKYIDKTALGIEIAPWFQPLVAKSKGFNSKTLDVFSTEMLLENAMSLGMDAIPEALEAVDFVCDASLIGEVVGPVLGEHSVDYVLSAHNFEHIPNPIAFLQGCATILKDEGVLTMALPDKRGTFDYFRSPSATSDMLQAMFEKRTRPTEAQIFAQQSAHCRYDEDGTQTLVFDVSSDPQNVVPINTVQQAYATWIRYRSEPRTSYEDCHCWVLTPASFELVILDLNRLGLCDFLVVESVRLRGEFVVHLRKRTLADMSMDYTKRRAKLLRDIVEDLAENAPSVWRTSWPRRLWRAARNECWLIRPPAI